MIKKSIVTFSIIFVLYNLLLILFSKGNLQSAQYQYQINIIKADRYIFNKSLPNSVVIGTSLSAKINNDSLPNTYSLAMSGLNVFDGLHILLKRNTLPKNIFIETNYFYKEEQKNFTETFDSPMSFLLKKNILALREENQPLGLIKHFLKNKKNKRDKTPNVPESIFNELTSHQYMAYQKVDTVEIEKSLLKLKLFTKEFASRGSKVIFFEMPINDKLKNQPLPLTIRNKIKSTFPNVPFISPPLESFKTLDGTHLLDTESETYSGYFKTKLATFN